MTRKKECRSCGEFTRFKNFASGLYKYEGEKVLTCKQCGHLRTSSQYRVPEAEIIHITTQTKKKNMENN